LPTWVLGNHDLVRAATRYGGGPLGRERALAATALILGLPGAPYLYEGEELAAEQVSVPPSLRQDPIWKRSGYTREGRDGCRTPVPWDGVAPGFGFTTGSAWLPFAADAATSNVLAQQGDPSSPWSVLARLLSLRRSLLPTLGDTVSLLPSLPDVLLLLRTGADSRSPGLLLALNTSDAAATLTVSSGCSLLAATAAAAVIGTALTLPPRSTAWLAHP
jgi:alpha-glucosidase